MKTNLSSGVLTKDGFIETKAPKIYNKSDLNMLNHVLKFDSLENVFFPEKVGLLKTDSNESNFLRDSLTGVIKQVIQKWYPDYSARSLFPFVRRLGKGYDAVRYDENDSTGRARLAGKNKTGMPLVEDSLTPNYSAVYKMELGAKYTLYELENSILFGESISARKLMNTKDGHELAVNECAFGISLEDDEKNIPGLLNQTSKLILEADASALADVDIYTETPQNNYDWLVSVINCIYEFTKKKSSIPNTLAMPIEAFNFLNTQRMNNLTGETVLSEILAKTSITKIVPCSELNDTVYGNSLVC
jgi:hypothetical protein